MDALLYCVTWSTKQLVRSEKEILEDQNFSYLPTDKWAAAGGKVNSKGASLGTWAR